MHQSHIQIITEKGNQALKEKPRKFPQVYIVKEKAHKSLLRPHLEYAS